MLFFIDESWQQTKDGKYKVGVLGVVQIKCHDYNQCSNEIYNLKKNVLGYDAGNIEIKGKAIFRNYLFKLESKGIISNELGLARKIFNYIQVLGVSCFASVVWAKKEIELSCANENQLERPFFFLFERIDQFMKENHPEMKAHIIFDDRGIQTNRLISKSVSNFFHKSTAGRSFESIIKTPFFAISTESIGIQIADMFAYIIGARFTGRRKIKEFFEAVKKLEFQSRALFSSDGKSYCLKGIKVIKEKEAGNLSNPEGLNKSIR